MLTKLLKRLQFLAKGFYEYNSVCKSLFHILIFGLIHTLITQSKWLQRQMCSVIST